MLHLENASKYAEQVRKGFCKELIVYEADRPDNTLDLKASDCYHETVDLCCRWMRQASLGILLMNPEYQSLRCTLRLPSGDSEIEVGVKASDESAGGIFIPQVVFTPIGAMSDAVLRTLLAIEDNPITVMYRHLGVLSNHLHNLLAMRGQSEAILTQDILMANGIQDPIMVHEMDGILYNIDDFFDRKV